ncbi:hypothetical protein HN51_048052 [Arachis hypogaea]
MKQYNTAVSLVSMLEFKGITPSIVTMNILINCSCHLDQTDSAFSALAKIIKWAHRFCVITLKFEHHSVRVLYQSKETTFQTGVVMYTTVNDRLRRDELVTEAANLFGKMIARRIPPTVLVTVP